MYKHFPNYVVRSPLNNKEKLTDWLQQKDEDQACRFLRDYFTAPEGRSALYLASPDLCDQLDQYESLTPEKRKSLHLTLLKYFSRSCTRSTPYGMFAGVSLGAWNDLSTVKIRSRQDSIFRLDCDYLSRVKKQLMEDDEIKENLVYYANSSVYTLGKEIRYFDFSDKNYLNYKTAVLEFDALLTEIIQKAKDGVPFVGLLNFLTREGYSEDESKAYLFELIDNKILLSALEPTATGDGFERLLDILAELKACIPNNKTVANWAQFLNRIDQQLASLSREKDTAKRQKKLTRFYRFISTRDLGQQNKFLLNVVSNRPAAEAGLSEKIKDEVLNFVSKFVSFASHQYGYEKGDLNRFTEKFSEVYENQKVPLMLVLDPEAGLGYPYNSGRNTVKSEILKLIDFKEKKNPSGTSVYFSPFEELIIAKMRKQENAMQVDISDVFNKAAMGTVDPRFADTASCKIRIFKEGEKRLIFFESFGDAGAARILGRFALYNKDIKEHVQRIRAKEIECAGDALVAELIHIPQDRIGNVVNRPPLGDYEIPFITNSYAKNRIFPEDLFLSVKNNRLVLESESLGKEIMPRISNAHAYDLYSLPLNHFLGDMQNNGRLVSLMMYPNNMPKYFKFIPRVTCGNVVAHLATWFLDEAAIDEIKKLNGPEAWASWKSKLRMPDHIALASGDRELFIDLNNPLCRELLIKEIAGASEVKIIEYPFLQNASYVHNEKGESYCAEFHLSFYKNKTHYLAGISKTRAKSEIHNTGPDERWLYFKIYGGPLTLNRVFNQKVYPLFSKWEKEGVIDKWFFIRFYDNDHHLRIRACFNDLEQKESAYEKINALFKPYLATQLIRNVQVDLYRPEWDRYGRQTMDFTERLFQADSRFATEYHKKVEKTTYDTAIFNVLFALKATDALIENFNLSFEEKYRLAETMSNAFLDEFGDRKYLAKQCNSFFKANKDNFKRIFDPAFLKNEKQLGLILNRRSEKVADLFAANKNGANFLESVPPGYLPSIIHMSLNRLFLEAQRKHEMLVYTTLFNKYRQEKFQSTHQDAF